MSKCIGGVAHDAVGSLATHQPSKSFGELFEEKKAQLDTLQASFAAAIMPKTQDSTYASGEVQYRRGWKSSKVISLTNVAMVNIFKENGVRFLPNEQKKASKEVENLLSIEFEGKNAVLLFYKSFDGGVFPDGAFLYRDSFFNVKKNDYNMLDIGCFFRVSELEIFSRLISLTKSSRDKEAYLLSFANDSSGNIYCIEEGSGKVFYIHHEEEECVTEVAPSFLLFCENLSSRFKKRRNSVNDL